LEWKSGGDFEDAPQNTMPKKWAGGEDDSRGAKAKAQRAEAEEEKKRASEKKKAKDEEREWADGVNERAIARAAEEKAKREEKERREREKAEIIAREEAEGGASVKKGEKGLVRGARAAGGEKVGERRAKRVEDAAAELAMLMRAPAFSGSGMDAALSALEGAGLAGKREPERHPERRRKAAFKDYEERELVRMRMEKPGLKLSQYKEMVFKAWQKSPENPMNGESVAYNSKRPEPKEGDEEEDEA
jgi:Coiled-coil domain-containing protein 124 /Oxs1